jgi:hypothetical protein
MKFFHKRPSEYEWVFAFGLIGIIWALPQVYFATLVRLGYDNPVFLEIVRRADIGRPQTFVMACAVTLVGALGWECLVDPATVKHRWRGTAFIAVSFIITQVLGNLIFRRTDFQNVYGLFISVLVAIAIIAVRLAGIESEKRGLRVIPSLQEE